MPALFNRQKNSGGGILKNLNGGLLGKKYRLNMSDWLLSKKIISSFARPFCKANVIKIFRDELFNSRKERRDFSTVREV